MKRFAPLLAFALARRSSRLALWLPLLALTPPAFVFVGIIWRDVLFATTGGSATFRKPRFSVWIGYDF